jgi:hypothetical protein
MLYTMKTLACVVLAMLSFLVVGCAVDRSDPKAVSEAAFRAIMAKDYSQLRQLVGCGAVIPDEQLWQEASFIRDRTVNEMIKQAWRKGSVGGYALNEVTMEDFQGPRFLPEKLVEVHFIFSDKRYVATFPITLCDNQWSPGMNPTLGDFFVRFEEPGE